MATFKAILINGNILLITLLQSITVSWAQGSISMTPPPVTAIETLNYLSVFKNYQPYSEEEVTSWQKANATVEKIGGWKAYAKEAAKPDKLPEKEGASTTRHEGMK